MIKVLKAILDFIGAILAHGPNINYPQPPQPKGPNRSIRRKLNKR